MVPLLSLESEPSKVTVSGASPVVAEGEIAAIGGVLPPATSSLGIEKGKGAHCGLSEPSLKMAVRVKLVVSFSSDILQSMAVASGLLMVQYQGTFLVEIKSYKWWVARRGIAPFNMYGMVGCCGHSGKETACCMPDIF